MKLCISSTVIFAIVFLNGCAAHWNRLRVASMINQPDDRPRLWRPALPPVPASPAPSIKTPEAVPLSRHADRQ